MTEFLAAAFLFLAVVAGAVWLLAPRRGREGERRVRDLRPPDAAQKPQALPVSRRARSSIPTLQRLLRDSEWADATVLDLERAHLQLRAGEYLLLRIALALAGFAVVVLVLRFSTWGIVLGMAAAAVAFMTAPFYVRWAFRQRVAKTERQLTDFLPSLASSLRAGFSFQQGIENSLQQVGDPLQEELRLLVSDVNLGATMQQALVDMGRRIGSAEIDMLVTAILVQRTTGGNLSEVLDQVAETLRERERIRGEIMTLTASQRLTGVILSLWPIAVGLFLLAILPEMWGKMFTETIGRVMLSIALGLQFIGFLLIRRATNIHPEDDHGNATAN